MQNLPGNTALCLAIEKCARENFKSVSEVWWNLAIERFDCPQNVIAHEISSIYSPQPLRSSRLPHLGAGPMSQIQSVEMDTVGQRDIDMEMKDITSCDELESEFDDATSDSSSESEFDRMSRDFSDSDESSISSFLQNTDGENGFMTPKWLSDCIDEFVDPLIGIDLNLLGHKGSLVKTKPSFGD